jgi:hypothetical protein
LQERASDSARAAFGVDGKIFGPGAKAESDRFDVQVDGAKPDNAAAVDRHQHRALR